MKRVCLAQKYRTLWRHRVWYSRFQPNAVFVWIPKNAGTTVFASLTEARCVKLNRMPLIEKYFRNRGIVTFGHMDYMQLKRANYISSHFDSNAFKFCIVRNPYDRAISLFRYLKTTNPPTIPIKITFEEFLLRVRKGVPPIGLYNVSGLSQCNPQVSWLNGVAMDHVGRVEEIDKTLHILNKRFKLNVPCFGRNNTSGKHEDRNKYLDRKAMTLIQDIYRDDFKELGYDFDR